MTGAGTLFAARQGPTTADVASASERARALTPLIDRWVTPERVLRYVRELACVPAPSSAALEMRGPVLARLWTEDEALAADRLRIDADFGRSGELVVRTGPGARKPLWYVAHLDTISYLVRSGEATRYRLVPYCYHLTETGVRDARALRYDLETGRFVTYAEGMLVSRGGVPYFEPASPTELKPGDRVVPVAPFSCGETGLLTGHLDNAGGMAALAVAAPLLGRLGIDALFAFPDEEEGPVGNGNQVSSRGAARIAAAAGTPPDLAVVVDMQQFDAAEGLGAGAVLSEFASGGRGSVTPPPLYGATRAFFQSLTHDGLSVVENASTHISRSDDVSLMLRTSSILLLGFPGTDRHFDARLPQGHLSDLVHLTRALVYVSALCSVLGER